MKLVITKTQNTKKLVQNIKNTKTTIHKKAKKYIKKLNKENSKQSHNQYKIHKNTRSNYTRNIYKNKIHHTKRKCTNK